MGTDFLAKRIQGDEMFNRVIIQALLVGGLGIAVAGCAGELFGQPIFGYVEPEKQTAKPKTEAVEPKTASVISKGSDKPQTRAEELDQYCADKTGGFISSYVEVFGQRLTCEQYLSRRAKGWSPNANDVLGKTSKVEKIIRLKNAGVSDEMIIQLLQSGRGNLPR